MIAAIIVLGGRYCIYLSGRNWLLCRPAGPVVLRPLAAASILIILEHFVRRNEFISVPLSII